MSTTENKLPHIGKQPAVAATAAVVRSDGLVQLCGLFPASDRSARVLVPATSSPTGLRSRSLSLMELGGLWDIPISVMDSLVGPASGNIYRALFDTPPTKSLLVGADSLLTTSFRGGLQGLLAGRPRKGGKGVGYLGVTMGLSRKRARLGTPNSLGISESSDLRLAAPQPLEPSYPNLLIMKGDAQKADNAAVPDHLWLGMFASGYGSESCLTRHCLALGRPSASPGGLKEPGPPTKGCGWEKAMAGFRTFGLRHWRRQLLRGFLKVEERECAAPDTPTNAKSDGEEPQGVEGWGP